MHKEGYLLLVNSYRFEPEFVAQLMRMKETESDAITVYVRQVP